MWNSKQTADTSIQCHYLWVPMTLVNLEYLTWNHQLLALISKRKSGYFDPFLSVLPSCRFSQRCGVSDRLHVFTAPSTCQASGTVGICQRTPKGTKCPHSVFLNSGSNVPLSSRCFVGSPAQRPAITWFLGTSNTCSGKSQTLMYLGSHRTFQRTSLRSWVCCLSLIWKGVLQNW